MQPDERVNIEQEILRQRELTFQLLASGQAIMRRAEVTLDRIQAQLAEAGVRGNRYVDGQFSDTQLS